MFDADSPVVRCDAPAALIGETNVVLTCEVKARPGQGQSKPGAHQGQGQSHGNTRPKQGQHEDQDEAGNH